MGVGVEVAGRKAEVSFPLVFSPSWVLCNALGKKYRLTDSPTLKQGASALFFVITQSVAIGYPG